jgi:acyl-CoA synthetase (AMP-forming)/AMP-acid ligase II/acyl carrier protein
MAELTCIYGLLYGGQNADSHAIEAPGWVPLTYEQLRLHVTGAVSALNRMGYHRNDRIAVVLTNGPDMAITFLSMAAGFTCAPLNPLYSRPEFEFYLSDLGATALITSEDSSPAADAARGLNIPVIDPKTLYRSKPSTASPEFSRPEDTALVLHTSGTTSKPKRVPLTQANICSSARNIADSLRLGPGDRCLNVMPLFHIHGLVGALLSSVAAGTTTICALGFVAPEFMSWIRDLNPTWYTAVPTIHQKVLEMAKNDPAAYSSLRFIRSASSTLPVPVMRGLEERFKVPVIEAYGMTEASHQIAANPLPPLTRKPGSVGLPWGTKVAIVDGAGNMLVANEPGEVAIRGQSVTAGYENNPEANAAAFHDGWLRTGDMGYIDMNGYLHLLGRLKEIINRGGEKVSPFEVEEALLAYPGVKEAAVFPVPGGPLGEEVGAAVVAGDSITVEAIKDFLIPRLAYFKVPSRIVIVESLPKGPTGKVQRIGMAGRLGVFAERAVHQAPEKTAPMTRTEDELAKIWSEVLRRGDIGVLDNFLELGGDSLLATQVMSRIRKSFDVEIPIVSIIESGSLSELGRAIDRLKGEPSNG